jgi:hypothetical protein
MDEKTGSGQIKWLSQINAMDTPGKTTTDRALRFGRSRMYHQNEFIRTKLKRVQFQSFFSRE